MFITVKRSASYNATWLTMKFGDADLIYSPIQILKKPTYLEFFQESILIQKDQFNLEVNLSKRSEMRNFKGEEVKAKPK